MALVIGGFLHYMDMKKFLKNLLLWNCWSDFEINSQECSLGDPFQKLLRNFDPSIKMALVNGGCLHYMDMKKFLKNLLWNRWSDFEIISQECSLGDPFKKCSRNFDPSINMAVVNGGFLHYMDMKKFLKNLLLQNRLSEFEIILQECSLGDPFQKVFAKFWSTKKHGSDELGLLALYRDMKKFLKNLLLQICRSDFEIIPQECSFGDLFQKLFAKFWSVHKHGSGEWRLLALYGH